MNSVVLFFFSAMELGVRYAFGSFLLYGFPYRTSPHRDHQLRIRRIAPGHVLKTAEGFTSRARAKTAARVQGLPETGERARARARRRFDHLLHAERLAGHVNTARR
jgi:hypothetical protein